ncbi:NAD P-binding protein [Lentinula edodes]|uniref:NAD P-binding protein n=1 Tax=Lentinula edodes TaxID=5353 RepID=A0A1Q3E4H3_LENED|nr:NAD P-binding protein [Lentinula edodes]
MAPITNGRLIFKEIPSGYPVPGKTTVYDTSSTIDLENESLKGSILVKTLVLSVDPYLRGKMRALERESYTPPFSIDEPLYNYGVGKVVRSENPAFKAGDHVYGMLDFAEYFIPKDITKLKVIVRPEPTLPYSVYVGAAGMPGQTSYYGWKEYAKPKAGEIIFVSTAAGPVGSLVVQLAKQDGLKVIASAGSDEKVKFCKEIGADVAFNYKTTNTADVLAKEGPINIYWDNVGGPTLEAAIGNSALHGRIIICGFITQYNDEEPYGIKTMRNVLANRLSINGLLVFDHQERYLDEFYEVVPKKLASGEFKYTEDITRGLDKGGSQILLLQIPPLVTTFPFFYSDKLWNLMESHINDTYSGLAQLALYLTVDAGSFAAVHLQKVTLGNCQAYCVQKFTLRIRPLYIQLYIGISPTYPISFSHTLHITDGFLPSLSARASVSPMRILERRKPTKATLDEFRMLQIRVIAFDENTEKCFHLKASPSGLEPEERIMNEKDLGPGLPIGVVSFLSRSQRDEILKSFGTKVIKAKENNLSYIQEVIADLTASWKEGMTLGIDNRPPYTTHDSN